MTETFWVEPTGEALLLMRRYSPGDGCSGSRGYHDAQVFDARWLSNAWRGDDGIALIVVLPTPDRHPWHVDAESSNCTRKGDRSHKCWVRHGDPRTDRITVDKNGDTCQAGAGSIAVEGYHGFLQNGVLT